MNPSMEMPRQSNIKMASKKQTLNLFACVGIVIRMFFWALDASMIRSYSSLLGPAMGRSNGAMPILTFELVHDKGSALFFMQDAKYLVTSYRPKLWLGA